ncbi:uncharacterized protein LOC111704325 isoform X3 [Eurytemora carolleeae]|uniref:uncharacterized protein LOC111704325 isoform X3 n=1 Tax=Eurytemora carolleeae TaxID=1294199 RepID=UPI000C762C1A|nr:uncharacterized protein LOC111704325 isoform X3 [Eurytemora carolleeae]|eukprot:XP_023332312.1 uncharacterized protein LOC111704325 isoform X3 [Eurytemora affinis]
MKSVLVYLFVFLGQIIHSGTCSCYISAEYQGVYLTQSQLIQGGGVDYSRVDVLPNSIPNWGECYRKSGRNIILKQSVINCFRCLRLILRSHSILQVYSRSLDKCYTRESTAVQSCPTDQEVLYNLYNQIHTRILYRIQDGEGGLGTVPSYCPINGQYTFNYIQSPTPSTSSSSTFSFPTSTPSSCTSDMSRLSNCPLGSRLNLSYNGCNFGSRETGFECLGSWPGRDQTESYIGFLETGPDTSGPKYRCGLYSEVPGTGEIYLALSQDSTCTNHLKSSTEGYEQYTLRLKPTSAWPSLVTKTRCRFPAWTEGYWEDLYINDHTMVFQDKKNFKTYSAQCIQGSEKNKNRFLIYARTQCGEELYNCVWFEERGSNILEFQLGLRPSQSPSFNHCDNDHFLQRTWFTQARQNPVEAVSCPISGEFVGALPDAPGLCGKMTSDCYKPDTMFYSVSDCSNRTNIYQGVEEKKEEEIRNQGFQENSNFIFPSDGNRRGGYLNPETMSIDGYSHPKTRIEDGYSHPETRPEDGYSQSETGFKDGYYQSTGIKDGFSQPETRIKDGYSQPETGNNNGYSHHETSFNKTRIESGFSNPNPTTMTWDENTNIVWIKRPEYIASIRPLRKRSILKRSERSETKYTPSQVYDPFNPWTSSGSYLELTPSTVSSRHYRGSNRDGLPDPVFYWIKDPEKVKNPVDKVEDTSAANEILEEVILKRTEESEEGISLTGDRRRIGSVLVSTILNKAFNQFKGDIRNIKDVTEKLRHGVDETDNPRKLLYQIADRPRERLEQTVDRPREGLDLIADRPREGLDLITDRPREGLDLIADRPREGLDLIADRPREGLDNIADRPKDGLNQVADRPRDGLDQITDRPRDGFDQIAERSRDRLNQTVDRQKIRWDENEDRLKDGYNPTENSRFEYSSPRTRISMFGRMDGGWCTVYLHTKERY